MATTFGELKFIFTLGIMVLPMKAFLEFKTSFPRKLMKLRRSFNITRRICTLVQVKVIYFGLPFLLAILDINSMLFNMTSASHSPTGKAFPWLFPLADQFYFKKTSSSQCQKNLKIF